VLGLPELRKDYLLDFFVIIATERAKRPHQFAQEIKEENTGTDYFGPGNEHQTPAEIYRVNDSKGNWQIRVFPNKFAFVGDHGKIDATTDNTFYTYADAVGRHEVVVETPNLTEQLWDLNADVMKQVLDVFCLRMNELKKDPKTKYISIFKNHKKEAGTSILHTHWQIVSLNIIPPEIQLREQKANEFYKKNGQCPYCAIISSEKDSFRRIKETKNAVSFTPYASRFIMEAWVLPKREVNELTELNDEEKFEIADHLMTIVKKLKAINAPFNIVVNQGIDAMHLYFSVMPRLATWAGFEYETGIIVNPVSPEEAAKFYRGEH
jgi:UDPglucose--hexose-1-phosphate uridylyltransferase